MNSDDDTLAGGLPHSEIPGSPIARISPGLFAACHVLHRLSVPRHPPDALTSRLITGVSATAEPKGSAGETPHTTAAHRAKTPNARRPRMKTLLRTGPGLAARAYPPRSHHNSLSSPFNQHPPRRDCEAVRGFAKTPPRTPMVEVPMVEVPMVEVPMVEVNGIEPMTSCLQSRRSPNRATPP